MTGMETPSNSKPVWHLTLSYDGRAYCGWQVQPKHTTVQGLLEARLRILFNSPELYVVCLLYTSDAADE